MNTQSNAKLTLSLIFLAAASRLLPHPPNVTPLAAMALLGGSYLSRKQAYLFPLLALILSDLVLGFHSTLPFVYIGFAATVALGIRIKSDKGFANLALASFAASIVFFALTNFGVWAMPNGLYPKTLGGLLSAFAAAIPFYRNSLLGDLGFTLALFGIEEACLRYQVKKALKSAAI
ncbi:MAG: hypothetical protein HY611_02430 [Elusimicrobia bacterium]|nr:hypothetical protein [Elusimicrobiota bacterium]